MNQIYGKIKSIKAGDIEKLNGVERLQLANKKDITKIEGIDINKFWEPVTPEDMMNLFLINFKVKDKLNREQMEELKQKCNNEKYIRDRVDGDGYPVDMEGVIYCAVEQYFIDELGWDEEWMSNR